MQQRNTYGSFGAYYASLYYMTAYEKTAYILDTLLVKHILYNCYRRGRRFFNPCFVGSCEFNKKNINFF